MKKLDELAKSLNGKIESEMRLPDGSGCAVISMPLPKDHWLTKNPDEPNEPPMPFRMGTEDSPRMNMTRQMWADALCEAGKYAIRCATMNGKENDFDPDALLKQLVVGFLGYWTSDGLTHLK